MKKLPIILIIIQISNLSFTQDTLKFYLDDNFQQTEKENAKYIRNVIVANNHYYLTDKNIEGKTIIYCEYKSFDPWIEDGNATHYYSPDILFSKGKYKDGKMVGLWIYYSPDNKTDTVVYSAYNECDNLQNCNVSKLKKLYSNKTKKTTDDIIQSLNEYLSNNFHLPARALSVSDNFTMYINCIIDTLGKVTCLELSGYVHEDINREICRVLSEYKYPYKLEYPIMIKLQFNFSESNTKDDVYFIVEEMPEFHYKDCVSGKECFRQYIVDSLNRNLIKCNGRVFVQFIVDIDGKIKDINFVRGIEGCNDYIEEIERVFYSCPPWIPGKQRGVPVKVQFTFPIVFVNPDEN